jgi:hypothetical protein
MYICAATPHASTLGPHNGTKRQERTLVVIEKLFAKLVRRMQIFGVPGDVSAHELVYFVVTRLAIGTQDVVTCEADTVLMRSGNSLAINARRILARNASQEPPPLKK